MYVGTTVNVEESTCTKLPGEKAIPMIHDINRNNIDMVCLVELHVLIPNKPWNIVCFVDTYLVYSHVRWDSGKRP